MSSAVQVPEHVRVTLTFGTSPSNNELTGKVHAFRPNTPPSEWVPRCSVKMGTENRNALSRDIFERMGDRQLCENCAALIDEVALLGAHVEMGDDARLIIDDMPLFTAVHCPTEDSR